ncbi:DUF448 domain-containing protein [Campylobacter gastrosuis]|uniref:YlxR domain-containing protein n=1 Tax=Campylobacter gastrosuis TaxID=2974576 RepID=A0ABT7HMS4_9BACT|nr:DUF448 domain-containing protein [Campylobacter gastrosuis]MDL0087965.1 hypothetical protein [Campylobacter gastrosuis]
MNKNNPIRTCVLCRLKFSQSALYRYRYNGKNLEYGKGKGRSFYLCGDCLKKDEKIVKKILDRHTKGANLDVSSLKEIFLDVKC